MDEERSSVEIIRPKISVYPKKLPKLQHQRETPDDTGLTVMEKLALKNTWRKLKPRLREIAMQVYLGCFSQNEQLLEAFRVDGKLMVAAAAKHPQGIHQIFTAFFEHIDQPRELGAVLNKMVKLHRDFGVMREHFEIYLDYVNKIVLEVVKDQSSQTIVDSLEKMKNLMLRGFDAPLAE